MLKQSSGCGSPIRRDCLLASDFPKTCPSYIFFAGFYFWGEFCVAQLAWNNNYLSLRNSWETQANGRHSPVPLLIYSLKSSGMWFLSPHFAAHHTHSTLLKLIFQRHTKTSQQIFKMAFHWTFVFLGPWATVNKDDHLSLRGLCLGFHDTQNSPSVLSLPCPTRQRLMLPLSKIEPVFPKTCLLNTSSPWSPSIYLQCIFLQGSCSLFLTAY